MAHDRQLEPEERIPLPAELQERKNESSKQTDNQSESLGVLADWWSVFGQIYRDDPTELLATAFRETLAPLKPEILHQACLIACRECSQFRPKPGQIYAIAEALIAKNAKGNRPAYLDEPKPNQEERDAAIAETGEAMRKRLGLHA